MGLAALFLFFFLHGPASRLDGAGRRGAQCSWPGVVIELSHKNLDSVDKISISKWSTHSVGASVQSGACSNNAIKSWPESNSRSLPVVRAVASGPASGRPAGPE